VRSLPRGNNAEPLANGKGAVDLKLKENQVFLAMKTSSLSFANVFYKFSHCWLSLFPHFPQASVSFRFLLQLAIVNMHPKRNLIMWSAEEGRDDKLTDSVEYQVLSLHLDF